MRTRMGRTRRSKSVWHAVRWPAAAAALVAVTGAAILATGCGDKAALDGTSWRLVAWSISAIDPNDFTITARFEDGRIGGTSAVNTYGAEYETGGDGKLTIGSIMSTEMAGPEPAMEAEAVYIELLQQVRAYRLDDDTLTLLDADGDELLVFAPSTG